MRVIQVTNDDDGSFVPRMYSYWSNAVVLNEVYVFAGHEDGTVHFFQVNRDAEVVGRLGSLLPYRGTSEGWRWDIEGWIYLLEGPRLRRVNPFTGEDRVVFDISDAHPGCDLWQSHSSDDGRTHSATVRQIVGGGAYPKLGTVVVRDGQMLFFQAQGSLDESQVTRSGSHVIIKENDDNRVVNLQTRETIIIRDSERALGHSDCGSDFIVGEADKPDPGACGLWDLTQPLTPGRFRLLFPTTNMGYVSTRGGRCLWSNDTHLSLVNLNNGAITLLVEHGGGTSYDDRVKANLDPTGQVACYMVGGQVRLLKL